MDPSNFILPNKRDRSESAATVWVDKYEPRSEAAIGVRADKIKEVKKAIEQSALFNDMIKLLILTGPTGSGKSALIRLLSRSYGFEITDWETPFRSWSIDIGHMEAFRQFMDKSIYYNTLDSLDRPNKGKIILLDDIPDLTTFQVKQEFYSILRSCLDSSANFLIVLIASDSFETSENNFIQNQARTIAPDSFKIDPRVEFIEFRPVVKTSMKKVLKNIIQKERLRINDNKLEEIIEISHGDIRNAINTLQFLSPRSIATKKLKTSNPTHFDDHIGNLSLFHAVGKVIYAKREPDGTFKSKPEDIMKNLPIKKDYFVDYIHQNCPGFYNDIDDLSKALDDLSLADTLRSENDWVDTQASNYRCIISIHGIMKHRKGEIKGSFKELEGTRFEKISTEREAQIKKDYDKLRMDSVKLRQSWVVWEDVEEPEEEMMIEKMFSIAKRPSKKRQSIKPPAEPNKQCPEINEDAAFDELFGDGSELADLDF